MSRAVSCSRHGARLLGCQSPGLFCSSRQVQGPGTHGEQCSGCLVHRTTDRVAHDLEQPNCLTAGRVAPIMQGWELETVCCSTLVMRQPDVQEPPMETRSCTPPSEHCGRRSCFLHPRRHLAQDGTPATRSSAGSAPETDQNVSKQPRLDPASVHCRQQDRHCYQQACHPEDYCCSIELGNSRC